MKKGAKQILKSSFKLFFLFILFFVAAENSFAQETDEEETKEQEVDSVKTGFSLGKLVLENPESIVSKYIYDPKLDRYIYNESVGDFNISYPIILTSEQYFDLVRKEGMKEYFKEKADAYSGKKEGSDEARKNLLPNFYVNNNFFQSVFGGNTIEVIPQGSVAMDLGVIWQKNDNPSLSPRNRTNLSFDFDQRISLSMLGKIGERLQVTANYDTEATFDFQNIVKLDYTPTEDDIIQSIEVGNVNMPLNSSLISGAQSLFGVKTQLQFGKTKITAVFSEQRSQNNTVVAQGGGTVNDFSITALDYDEDKHFFLSQYFRDNYDTALENYPYIRSQVQITRLEVWVTNRSQQTLNVRNVVAIQDLGEPDPTKTRLGQTITPAGFFDPSSLFPRNDANDYDPTMVGSGALTQSIRDIATVENGFNVPGYQVNQGFDYAILENARKLNQGRDFDFNSQLGYISLNQRLSNDEVLGVAFQYTVNGEVFQVGEFANGGLDATTVSPGVNPIIDNNTLILKLLKSNVTNITDPIWDLMMKNIYATGAFRLSQEDFKLNILYTDPTPRNYITPVQEGMGSGWPDGLQNRILLDVFNLDRLNSYNDVQPGGDGFFDFVPGLTVNTQNGLIIFTKVEPFGKFLFDALDFNGDYNDEQTYNENQAKYVFRDMYELTKSASLQNPAKNKFLLKGRYKSEGSNGIPIGAFNVPRGSVRVTAGGRQLQEGIDYTVNYQAGTVQILDPSLEASNTPINISVENNAVFGQQTRRFTGINVEHQVNKNFMLGGTLLNLNERPLTQKSNFGVEPVNNTIFGLNGNFSTEVPFLTRLVNKLPNIDTDVQSNISVRAEVAWLKPNSPKNADFRGETTTYLDDFEGAQALIDIRSSLGWTLASVPDNDNFKDGDIGLGTGHNRAKMSWYTIDPIFYTNQRPSGISDSDMSINETRRIFINNLFAQDVAAGQTQVQNTLNINYYPDQKGPYNNNASFNGLSPNEKWAGIMRSLSSTNFEQANVEFVQFWVLDPYVDGITNTPGELVFNFGNISEDVLKDGRKQYENGLPGVDSNDLTRDTEWGKVPATQALVYAFDANENNRALQDIGLDGLSDNDESTIYTNNNGADPALDNYQYYLNRDGGIMQRYLDFNNPQGNSPVAVSNTNRGSNTLPDVEDIDRDLTMNTINSYYEYRVQIKPNTTIDDQYVTDILETAPVPASEVPDGSQVNRRWIQYKIPLSDFTEAVGGITDFRSISFMRMYLTGFNGPTVLRFATLDLVRGDWRTYTKNLQDPNVDIDPSDDNTTVDVNAINIEENQNRMPIPYVLPPGVVRERLNNNNTIIRQNEQSLSFVVDNLEPGDSRGVFKSLNIDIRQYKKLKMFMHAEKIQNSDYTDDALPLVGFLRIGTDFSENFYQIEVPLQFTSETAPSQSTIWPDVNELDISLSDLNKVKSLRIANIANAPLNEIQFFEVDNGEVVPISEFAPRTLGRLRIGIRGNPSLGSIRSMMVGVKNTDNLPARGELWFNELRLAGLDNNGGWAAIAAIDANLADFANVTATGATSTSGFGTIDQMPNERAREDATSYDVVTNVNIGQLLPKKWGIQIPFNYGISEQIITPEFDPVYDDLKLKDRIAAEDTQEGKDEVLEQAEDYTKRTSINFIGVSKQRGEEADANFYDIENFTFNYSYNEIEHRDFEIASLRDQKVATGFVYNHAFKPLEVAPFAKKDSLFTGKYWKWLKDLNFNVLPATISVNSNINRQFNQQRFRDVLEEGVDRLELPSLQQRNYQFNWQYAVNYSLTKSLRLNLTASNNSIVRNYFNVDGDSDSGINKNLELWDGFFDLGEPNRHAQNMELNYELPFSKIPALDFINAQYSYSSNFDWQRGGDALNEVVKASLGEGAPQVNTIQNANTHNLTATLSMQKLYDLVGLKKRDGKSKANAAPVRKDKAGNPAKGDKGPKKTSGLFNTVVDIVTMVKRLNINYNETNGKVLPGYTQSIGFVGTVRPTLGFVFGSQADVRFEAAKKGWLTEFPDFNEQYIERTNKQLNITATAQPIRDLTIDLVADRQFSNSYQENFKIDFSDDDPYQLQLGNSFGSFSISTIMIGTAFGKSDEFDSKTFQEFKNNRITIANRLVSDRQGDTTVDAEGFPVEYGKTQQDVLLPAFFSAYTGQDVNRVNLDAFRDIPIPNWNIKYTGLMRKKWFKKKFKRFSLSHGYRASYSINSFQTNLEKTQLINDGVRPLNQENGDLLSDLILNNVVLTDQFNPLVRVDFEMKNSVSVLAEVRKDRMLSLSLDNNLLTENNGKEYTLGLGYRFKDVKFVTNIGGNKTRLKGDLNLKADMTLRDNITIIRNLELDNNQITSGQNLFSIKFTADYALSKNLNFLFFYDHSFSKFAVSTAFPQTTINTGFTLRYNFGN